MEFLTGLNLHLDNYLFYISAKFASQTSKIVLSYAISKKIFLKSQKGLIIEFTYIVLFY